MAMSNGCRFNDAETVSAGCQNNRMQQRLEKRHPHQYTGAKGGRVPAFALLCCSTFTCQESTDPVRAPGVGEQIR